MITTAQIRQLRDKYLELVKLEIQEFGVKPTEVRHLIGRLGEFHCALQVGGCLAHKANQHGFDVICSDGRRISVKTTAQTTGFVPISKSTASRADDLMVVQFQDGELSTVYYGPIGHALEGCRFYEATGNYELDLSKARKLMKTQVEQQPQLLAILEGGAVYTIDRGGQYFVIINQAALLDMLDEQDRDGIEAVKELAFASAAERDDYIRMRGWANVS